MGLVELATHDHRKEDPMTTFVPTELRICGACGKDYVTALVTEEEGEELTRWEEPCPYCRVAPADVATEARRRVGAAGSR
jgi:hypothetical protein